MQRKDQTAADSILAIRSRMVRVYKLLGLVQGSRVLCLNNIVYFNCRSVLFLQWSYISYLPKLGIGNSV